MKSLATINIRSSRAHADAADSSALFLHFGDRPTCKTVCPPSRDAKLLALGRAFIAARDAYEKEASRIRSLRQRVEEETPTPDELRVLPRDEALFEGAPAHALVDNEFYHRPHVSWLAKEIERGEICAVVYKDGEFAFRSLTAPEVRDRRAAIVAAGAAYFAALDAAYAERGVIDPDSMIEGLSVDLESIVKRAASLRASTLGGIFAKAMISEWESDRCNADAQVALADTSDLKILWSIVRDLLALAGDSRAPCAISAVDPWQFPHPSIDRFASGNRSLSSVLAPLVKPWVVQASPGKSMPRSLFESKSAR